MNVCALVSVHERWEAGSRCMCKLRAAAVSVVALMPDFLRAGQGCPQRGAQRCFIPCNTVLKIKDILIFL